MTDKLKQPIVIFNTLGSAPIVHHAAIERIERRGRISRNNGQSGK
jgi:hypothetical protein